MTQEVKPQDHPDFIGGWIWTELEIRWIKERIAKAVLDEREACAKLIEELRNNPEPHKEYEDYDDGWVDACHACKWSVVARGEA